MLLACFSYFVQPVYWNHVCMFCRSQWSGEPKRLPVSSCLVRGPQSALWLHRHQQVSRETVCLPAGAYCHMRFSVCCGKDCPHTRRLRTDMRSCWTLCPITLFRFEFASVNTIKVPPWLTGNGPSEACDPLAAPAGWIAIPDDLISKR